METLLIPGRQPSTFHPEVQRVIGPCDLFHATGECPIWVSIKNEHDEIYLKVGMSDETEFKNLVDDLARLGWSTEFEPDNHDRNVLIMIRRKDARS